jgi:flagellar hook assembly protein FlgD
LSLPRREQAVVSVFDVRGALIRQVARREFELGRHLVQWDGLDESGRLAGPGIYFIRATAGGSMASLRCAVVR